MKALAGPKLDDLQESKRQRIYSEQIPFKSTIRTFATKAYTNYEIMNVFNDLAAGKGFKKPQML